jgi:hypothetical protein
MSGGKIEVPLGADRDAMFDGLAVQNANQVEKAFGYVKQIDDVANRRRAFDHVMWQALHESPLERAAAARQWLESADVPDTWKQAWRD